MQLVGTPQEQFNQVTAALEKVAAVAFTNTGFREFFKLRDSLAPHGIVLELYDDSIFAYRISMGGQSTCFLYGYVDSFAKEESLFQIACP